MAEALGVAGSVVSFIGLAGQVAQGVSYLYNFFNGMQDAPSDIRSLTEELKILGDILEEVGQDGIDSATLTAALQRCKDVTGDLEDLIRKSNLTSDQSKARKLWSQMSTAFRNEKFRKYTERLERAKSTLLHAKIQAHGSMHQQQLSGIKIIEESMSRMSLKHSEFTTESNEIARQTQNDLQALPSRVKGLVISEVSTTMAKTHTTCSSILTEVRESSAKADLTSEEIRLAIQSLLSDPGTSRIATLLQPALEKAVSDQIASSMEALTAHLGRPQLNTPDITPDITPDPNADISTKDVSNHSENEVGLRSLNQFSATTTCIRWAGTSKVINFWFGRLMLLTSFLESWEGRGNGSTLQKAKFLETKATLIPSKWLLRKGVVLKITRLVSAIASPSVQFSLTPIMVISEDNEIVGAMRYGDLTKVQRLILGGKVHPSSIFPDGSSLVYKCVQELHEQDKQTLVADSVSETIQTLLKLIDIAVLLVSYGSAADVPNMSGVTPFSLLTEIYTADANSSLLWGHGAKKDELALSILRASSSSPFFLREPESGQMHPTDILRESILNWGEFLHLIANGSSLDIRMIVCLKTLHFLWNVLPYDRRHTLCEASERLSTVLTEAAYAGKEWLAGDPHESEECSRLLYLSIRGALLHASPFRLFKKYYFGWPSGKHTSRNAIIANIADMLRIDRDISTFSYGMESLTDCALRWRCLDIWKLSLEKSECQMFPSTIWDNNAHFYDPFGFVSREAGASVRVTRDVASGKVIRVVDERQYVKRHPHYYRNSKEEYLRDPNIKSLTKGWPCIVKLPQVHCEVYPSRPINVELANDEDQGTADRNANSRAQYSMHPTDDGGIELFIDCCEIGEPWERLCTDQDAEVRREAEIEFLGYSISELSEDEYSESEDEYSESEDEYSESEDEYSEMDVDEDSGAVSTGLFSKIAGVGWDVLSALV